MLYPCGRSGYSSRLTEIEMQESVAPESQELLLSGDSGTVHLISGHDGGGWVYGARVVRSFGWATSWAIRSAFSRCVPCYQAQGR